MLVDVKVGVSRIFLKKIKYRLRNTKVMLLNHHFITSHRVTILLVGSLGPEAQLKCCVYKHQQTNPTGSIFKHQFLQLKAKKNLCLRYWKRCNMHARPVVGGVSL